MAGQAPEMVVTEDCLSCRNENSGFSEAADELQSAQSNSVESLGLALVIIGLISREHHRDSKAERMHDCLCRD